MPNFRIFTKLALCSAIVSSIYSPYSNAFSVGVPWESTSSISAAPMPNQQGLQSIEQFKKHGISTLRFHYSGNGHFSLQQKQDLYFLSFANNQNSPTPRVQAPFRQIDMIEHEGKLTITLQLMADYSANTSMHQGESNTIEFNAKKSNATSPAYLASSSAAAHTSIIDETLESMNLRELDQHFSEHAKTLIAKGENDNAIFYLQSFLDQAPQAYQSAQLYLALLLQQQRYSEFKWAMDSARKIFPEDTHLVQLEARYRLINNDLNGAESLLSKHRPELSSDPEYYQLYAVISLLNGRPSQAHALYTQLLNHDNTNGRWWSGLGLALEQLGHLDTAYIAYNQAEAAEQIPMQMIAYIRRSRANQVQNLKYFDQLSSQQVTRN